MLLGVIADDFTGATDVGLALSREGMRVIQPIGLPTSQSVVTEADAVVVALKSRTAPVDVAVEQSLDAARFLLGAGARQILFKYCSTFDSTDQGNIGPVMEALMDFLEVELTIACPSFPQTGRTVFQGHLFVGQELLSDSPMRDHPLTPMNDANLVKVLSRQTSKQVGHVPLEVVDRGEEAIRTAFKESHQRGDRVLVIDAAFDRHLRTIGAAVFDMRLVTGASGVAIGMPDAFRRDGLFSPKAKQAMQLPSGRTAILAGSCSASTRRQVAAAMTAGFPAYRISPMELSEQRQSVNSVTAWCENQTGEEPLLVYSTADPDSVRASQGALGVAQAAAIIENTLASIAANLSQRGFSRFIVAGGETSGAVVEALGVKALRIGKEIDPGVPWTLSVDEPQVALVLKSGNFGSDDFFLKAMQLTG